MSGTSPAILEAMRQRAMAACNIFDEEEVGDIAPITYIEPAGARDFVTVWMFGNNRILSAMFELTAELDSMGKPQGAFIEEYLFQNVDSIKVDDYGCVICLNGGKKIELKSNSQEGVESFKASANGLSALWREYVNKPAMSASDIQALVAALQQAK